MACAIADLNADGCDDLAIANQYWNSVTVNLTVTPSLAQRFGTGCAGASGATPAIAAVGTPAVGTAAFTVSVTGARSDQLALLAFGHSASRVTLPGRSCSLYFGGGFALLPAFTSPTGAASITFAIPATVPLGSDAYLQWIVPPVEALLPWRERASDAAQLNAFALSDALSDGLRLQFGR